MLTQPRNDLTPRQQAIRQLALRQLKAVEDSLQWLLEITADQGDREAIQDGQYDVKHISELLTEWFGAELIEGE